MEKIRQKQRLLLSHQNPYAAIHALHNGMSGPSLSDENLSDIAEMVILFQRAARIVKNAPTDGKQVQLEGLHSGDLRVIGWVELTYRRDQLNSFEPVRFAEWIQSHADDLNEIWETLKSGSVLDLDFFESEAEAHADLCRGLSSAIEFLESCAKSIRDSRTVSYLNMLKLDQEDREADTT